ncbi:MAG TPA: 50S ribosomal protein L3 N(5)-glutamine methyltransferase [Gammaproteobacteria bacterium]|nr:50S ribosomal protein L3 N(5)-glutamine methyltransferase [Gammaproteobacteria bacterium]
MARKTPKTQSADAAVDELRTLQDLIDWGASRFTATGLWFGHGTDNARDEAAWLALHALSLPLDLDADWSDHGLDRAERRRVVELLERRIQTRQPAAYLTGEAWFCGLPFLVDESVLVPRSPIAELIQERFEPWLATPPARILDLGAGSGCIGIACAMAFPQARVDLSDVSEAALTVARKNIERHQLTERVHAIQSDVFDAIPPTRYDLIVTNPPYVDAADLAAMPDEYRAEPELGLAAGADGLAIAHRILADAARYLADDGVLIMEVGNSETALQQAYPQLPFIWLEFEWGGHGVCLLQKRDLVADSIPRGEG